MSKLEKWIILFSVIVIIIIIIISMIIYQRRGQIIYGIDETGSEIQNEFDETIKQVTVRNDFFAVESCVNKFYQYYSMIYDYGDDYYIIDEEVEQSIKEIQLQNAKAIYNMLDQEYIEAKQITENNILSKLQKMNKSYINVTNMYVSEKTSNMSVYIVYGTIRENTSGALSDFTIIVKLDALNRTFTILPQDYVSEKYKNIAVGSNIEIEVPERIEKNQSNKYDFESISDDEYVVDVINQIKEEMLYNPKLVYSKLDEEYRNAKFGNLDEFKIYAKNNTKQYVTIKIDEYQKTKTESYTQYLCQDTNGRYYIFRETAPMQYTLILDTYTIDIPEFTAKYQAGTDQEKVMLNINKFMLAINDKDYKYAYSVLADSFKKTNFPTLEAFETYMKTNFFNENEFEYIEFGDEAGTYYTYKVKVTDKSGKSTNTLEKTFIILLEEGTDFVMSFNIE